MNVIPEEAPVEAPRNRIILVKETKTATEHLHPSHPSLVPFPKWNDIHSLSVEDNKNEVNLFQEDSKYIDT